MHLENSSKQQPKGHHKLKRDIDRRLANRTLQDICSRRPNSLQSTTPLQNTHSDQQKRLLTNWMVPTQPNFQTEFPECHTILIYTYLNHLYYGCSYLWQGGGTSLQNGVQKWQRMLPNGWPTENVFLHRTLEIRLLWAWRPTIPEWKFQPGSSIS